MCSLNDVRKRESGFEGQRKEVVRLVGSFQIKKSAVSGLPSVFLPLVSLVAFLLLSGHKTEGVFSVQSKLSEVLS